jgi:hypothetical protein
MLVMSSKTVKFELSLEKLTVKFEGDIQIAERFQGEITGALNTLASTQNRMLAAGQAVPAAPPATEPPAAGGRRRGRRRKAGPGAGIDPSILDGVTVPSGNGDGSTAADQASASQGAKRQRRSSSGPSALITTLKTDGFFAAKRDIGAIRAALAQKGHSLQSNEVSPSLVSLTKQGVLKREQNEQAQWVYFAE